MGLFSGHRNNQNDTDTDQGHFNDHGHGNMGNRFGNHHNIVDDGRPSFSSYDQGNTYGDYNVNTGTTSDHGIFGRDHNAGLTDQSNTNNTTGTNGTMNRNRNGGLGAHHTNITRNPRPFSRNDGGALGQDANLNITEHQGRSRHDLGTASAHRNTNMGSNHHHLGQHGNEDYLGPSASSILGTRGRGWFSRRRNRDYTTKAGTDATTSGGWLSCNRRNGIMNSNRWPRSLSSRPRLEKFDINSGRYNRRPSFGQWLKFAWLDIVIMAVLGAVALGVNKAGPAPNRSFPVYFQDGEIVYPQFAYPVRDEIIPLWLAAFVASVIPIFIILCMQFRIRSFWDVNNAVVGLLYSLITAAVFQVFLKWLIGGLRPHFLTVCQPIIDTNAVETGSGLKQIYYSRSICSGKPEAIDESLESFPSGHSTAAFAGFIFLYLYLNAKLKVFSNHHAAMWKLVVAYAPVLGATLIAGTLTIDEYNNWYDVVAGAVIGTIMAVSAYRMVYASVWDFRFNHIPLTRHTPFSYGAGEAGAGGFETAVFSHAAGWGFEEAYGGAPFDAAHNLRGALAGFNHGVHDRGEGHNRSKTNDTTNDVTTGHAGRTDGGIIGHGAHDHPEKTGILGRQTNKTNTPSENRDSDSRGPFGQNVDTTHTHLRNIDTNIDPPGVLNSGKRTSMLEPTTSTRGGRSQQPNKSLERRPVGGGQGVQRVDDVV